MIKDKDQYKRLTIMIELLVLLGIHTVLFAVLWETLYKDAMVIPFFSKGNWAIILVYPLMALLFNKVFGGLRVAVAKVSDLIFSHVGSMLVTNALMYFLMVILIRKNYPSIMPLLTLWILQIVYIILWTIGIKALNNKIYPPHDMLLIHGDYSVKDFAFELSRHSKRYNITETVNIAEGAAAVEEKIGRHDSVVLSDIPAEKRNDVLKYCYDNSIRVYMIPKISDIIIRSAEDIYAFDSPMYLSKNYGLSMDQMIIKRIGDIVISGIGLVVLSWVMAIAAIAIKCYDKGPVFYKQDRLTRDGKVFKIIKFRSMRVDAEKMGAQLSTKKDPRVTPVGRFLRASHLDEIPQLFNVFKGDMSMVGPRPERPEIMAQYQEEVSEFNFRLKVKGGLTGYAQVYGRYNTTPYNKLRLDLSYIQNYSVWLDIKCLVLTVKVLFRKDNTEGIEAGQTNAIKK